MIFFKINTADLSVLPLDIVENQILLKKAAFDYLYVLQSDYSEKADIIILVYNDDAFQSWFENLENKLKFKISILSKETVLILSQYFIQICQPSVPSKDNKTLVEEYLNNI